MHPTEKVVRQFHESWDMRDPDRGAEVIADDCAFEDIARGEKLPGKAAYKADYHPHEMLYDGDWRRQSR